MNRIICAVIVLACAAPTISSEPQLPPAPSHPQLDRMKSLTGKWVNIDDSGKPTPKTVEYRVTAGDGTVIETLMPGTPHEMVTMYHMDGDSLMLTHYCMLQNQPRMRALPSDTSDVIQFKFLDGTGMKSTDESHMHEVTFTFTDNDHFAETGYYVK